MLNRGIIQGVHSSGQVKLTTDQSLYTQGGEIVFTGELEFSLNELVDITGVRLANVSGPAPLDTGLPLLSTGGQFFEIPIASGTLEVKVDFFGLQDGTSTGPNIPGTTLPGGIDGLKGITTASKIVFTVIWTPDDISATLGLYSAKLFVELKDSTQLESDPAEYEIIADSVVSISGPSDVNEASGTVTYIIKISPIPVNPEANRTLSGK